MPRGVQRYIDYYTDFSANFSLSLSSGVQESLLTALSDVVKNCSAAIRSVDSTIKPEEIVKCCLREARKESLGYKVRE